ncbi:hypothetical protein [Gordonia sputi]
MTSDRSLATRLYSRISRDAEFTKTLKAEGIKSVIVCVASDRADDVEKSLRRNYPGQRVAVATFFPDRHTFELTWMEWHDRIADDESRPVFTVPDDTTIGQQVLHAIAVDRVRWAEYVRSTKRPHTAGRSRSYSTLEMEKELATA